MKRSRWAIGAALFGVLLALGAAGEVMIAVRPQLLPEEALAIPFMRKHETELLLRAWIGVSNCVNFVCALTFVIQSARLPLVGAWRAIRRAATVLGVVATVSLPVALYYLLPLPTEPDARTATLYIGTSMIVGTTGLIVLCVLWRALALGVLGRWSHTSVAP